MDNRVDRARTLIEAALREVEAELSSPRCGLHPEQLCTCRQTLQGYLAALDGALPPRKERAEALGKLVVDGWPFDATISSAVLAAERAFRNA
jgi:hypothetical protein